MMMPWTGLTNSKNSKIRILKLPEYVQLSNRQGQLSERQCIALLAVAELKEVTELTPLQNSTRTALVEVARVGGWTAEIGLE